MLQQHRYQPTPGPWRRDRKIAFPIHNEPRGTDLGSNYLAVELRAEDGCLKLYRLGWDNSNRTVSDQLRDIWLPVWPSGFALRQEGQDIQVIDGNGAVAARAGDTVRFGGRSYWSDEAGNEEMEKIVPEACHGLYYLVSDEVSVVSRNEARVVRLPGSTLQGRPPSNETTGGDSHQDQTGSDRYTHGDAKTNSHSSRHAGSSADPDRPRHLRPEPDNTEHAAGRA